MAIEFPLDAAYTDSSGFPARDALWNALTMGLIGVRSAHVSMKIQVSNSITIADVARRAGVSVGTVSRVLNGYTNISPLNFRRSRPPIAELDYKKCQSAGLLVSRKNGSPRPYGNIGIVYTEIKSQWVSHPLIASYTLGVEEGPARSADFTPWLNWPRTRGAIPRCVREGKVDGLLIKVSREVPAFVQDLPENFPMVGVSFNDPSVPFFQVAPDNTGAGWVVADSLWQRGHRRIAFVCAQEDHPMFVARLQGYEAFLRSRGAFVPERVAIKPFAATVSGVPEETPPDMGWALEQLLGRAGE